MFKPIVFHCMNEIKNVNLNKVTVSHTTLKPLSRSICRWYMGASDNHDHQRVWSERDSSLIQHVDIYEADFYAH